MGKSKQKIGRAHFFQSIAVIFCGLILIALTFEIGLRVSGFIMASLREHKNMQSIKKKGSCRILCLGESTTQNQYPPYLDSTLSNSNTGIKFSIIDKGLVGADTGSILAQLEDSLDKYQPDIVVTMMGCNDGRIVYYQGIPESDTWLFRYCRTYRFSRLICMNILKKLKKEDIYKAKNFRPSQKDDPVYVKLGWSYKGQGKFAEAEQLFNKAIALNPGDDSAYAGLGRLYKDQGRHVESEQAYKKAIELNPKNEFAYTELSRIYRAQGKLSDSEQILKKALEFNPEDDYTYAELSRLYNDLGRYAESEGVLKRALEFGSRNDCAYEGLGQLYKYQGKLLEQEEAFRKAVELNPKNYSAYIGLGSSYRIHGKIIEAEQMFKKAIVLNPKRDFAVGGLATIYAEIGKKELSKIYSDKLNSLRGGYYNLIATNNYLKLKKILDKRKMKLVCVQYPMRNIQPLKKIFQDDENVIFVDNEKIFKDAVRKEGYNEYFVDMFGGDFGHCTQKGNRLLADNIAGAILKYLIRK